MLSLNACLDRRYKFGWVLCSLYCVLSVYMPQRQRRVWFFCHSMQKMMKKYQREREKKCGCVRDAEALSLLRSPLKIHGGLQHHPYSGVWGPTVNDRCLRDVVLYGHSRQWIRQTRSIQFGRFLYLSSSTRLVFSVRLSNDKVCKKTHTSVNVGPHAPSSNRGLVSKHSNTHMAAHTVDYKTPAGRRAYRDLISETQWHPPLKEDHTNNTWMNTHRRVHF